MSQVGKNVFLNKCTSLLFSFDIDDEKKKSISQNFQVKLIGRLNKPSFKYITSEKTTIEFLLNSDHWL